MTEEEQIEENIVNLEEPIQQPIQSTSLSTWNRNEAEKLILIVKKSLDLDKHLVKLPESNEPITFLEFESLYKKRLSYGETVNPTMDNDFINILDGIKNHLRTIVTSRLEDGLRKMLEVIQSLTIEKQELNKTLFKLNNEVSKMEKTNEDTAKLKEELEKYKDYDKVLAGRVDKLIINFKEDIERIANRCRLEIGLPTTEKEDTFIIQPNEPKVRK